LALPAVAAKGCGNGPAAAAQASGPGTGRASAAGAIGMRARPAIRHRRKLPYVSVLFYFMRFELSIHFVLFYAGFNSLRKVLSPVYRVFPRDFYLFFCT
jgi:hypothetical protein